MSFTARRILVGGEQIDRADFPVHRAKDIARWRDIEAVISRARRTAFSIVKDSRRIEKVRTARSAARRLALERDADRSFVERAAALEDAYRLARRALIDDFEATLDQVLAGALTRIGAELPAAQRLRIVCDRLNEAAGPMPAASLCLCAADESIYRAVGGRYPWPVQIDDTLQPGQCRLATEHGHWEIAFDALFASLSAALLTNGQPADDAQAHPGMNE
ncbi:HrpE/YscL family type III secretion apparatus protein [Trinickia sp. NRRL B-1857]|uniref:HrpE/YscL family type III secretion apparatus protein n=1 Tax=Trinickia sp. NRRL B-1857 TaxID=3162879 RepID=UPI003D2A7D6F